MQENTTIICNTCKEKTSITASSKVLVCPHCGSKDISYITNDAQDDRRYLFGVKVDTNQINDKLLWIAFAIVVIVLFVLLFSLKK